MTDQNALPLPLEIVSFLGNPGGHSLIVRGNAGTGKTTFALELAEAFKDRQGAYYLSTRVSDQALLQQFPWLGDRLLRREETGPGHHRSGLGRLKGVGSGEMLSSRREMGISIGRSMALLERLYELVEKGEGRQMIVVDSIDALADRYALSCRELIIALQRDLVEGRGANLVFVLESNDLMLDYLGDGVVQLTRSDRDRRLVREMDLIKLRGCEVQQPLYLFSLQGGRFRCFGAHWNHGCGTRRGWERVEDPDGHLSYGIGDLDVMTGGLSPGGIALIELGVGVPSVVSDLLERSLVANFANAGRGVLWVPLRESAGSNVCADLGDAVPPETMERVVRVVEPASRMDLDSGPYMLPVEGSRVAQDLRWKNVAYSLDRASPPFLSLMGLDSLESIYGRDVMDGLVEHLAAVRRNGGVFVGLTSPTSSSTVRLADLATVHLKVERIGGAVIMYGSKPFTECYALTVEERPRGGCVSLTPLL
jgi:KaiC/GvpD/RAD55 family RecA-like ATPase